MKFIEEVPEKEYKKFTDEHKKAHFLESYAWGNFCQKSKNQIAQHVGMEDDEGNLVATGLILLKRTPLFGYSYGYCPRGFLIDYDNKEYIKLFTNYLKDYMKKNKIIYIKFDPDIEYQDIDDNGNKVENGHNNYELYNYLKSLGYKHGGFYKLYDGNQPRYTFRIDLKQSMEEIEAKMSKSFLKSIKRSEKYNLIIDNDNRIHEFYELMKLNSAKDGFNSHSEEYYQTFYDELKKDNRVKMFNISIEPKKMLKNIDEEIKEQEELLTTATKKIEDIKNKIARLKKEQEEFLKYDVDKLVICSLICTYTKKRCWSLFIGNNDLANLTFAVSLSYYVAIKDAKEHNYDFFDLFGTVGDPNTTYKNLAHLHDYKRKFGDRYIEFIGEFDLINNKFLYKILPPLLKIYRKIRG